MIWVLAASATSVTVCQDSTCPSLQEIIDACPASEPVTLVLPTGLYTEEIDVTGRSVTLVAETGGAIFAGSSATSTPGRSNQILVKSGGELRMVDVTLAPVNLRGVKAEAGSTVVLEGVVVAPVGAGAGVRLEESNLAVYDSLFVDGVSARGAHVSAESSELFVFRSDFVAGTASERAGSIDSRGDGGVYIFSSSFSNNRGGRGGAISADGAEVWVFNSAFNENTALRGGAISTAGAYVQVESCNFEGNVGTESGGALDVLEGRLHIYRSTFCKNDSLGDGGAVFADTEAVIANNRFLDNVASRGGALVFRGEVVSNNFLGNRATLDGAAVFGLGSAQVRLSSVGWSDGGATAIAGSVRVESSNAWNNGVAVYGEDVFEGAGLLQEDPRLRGYEPGQTCGLRNDFHHPDGPLRRGESEVIGPGPHIDDVQSDIGAYGGPGAEHLAWLDADQDGWVALYDCNDSDREVSPGSKEDEPYDGIDQNCDGFSDYDQDRDGFDAAEGGGTDCDDTRADIHPQATDLSPTEDLNCDGVVQSVPYELVPESVGCRTSPGFGGVLLLPIVALLGRRQT